MPVNYPQLREQIRKTGETMVSRRKTFEAKREKHLLALATLQKMENLDKSISRLLQEKPNECFAIPGEEAINARIAPPNKAAKWTRLLACDGSQIYPNRHDDVSFGLINTAVIELLNGSGAAPIIDTHTVLIDAEEINGQAEINMRRDAMEKSHLADIAITEEVSEAPAIALCDGPLELFTETTEIKDLEEIRKEYCDALGKMAENHVLAAGYIDRPHSNPFSRMLMLLSDEDLEDALPDSIIFDELLNPGERSAIFGLNSRFNDETNEALSLHFFYLNIGRPGHPDISRVEIPAWAAADKELIGQLHRTLLDQCALLRDHPYPYILHRAHECAVINYNEKDRISGLILTEMLRCGLPVKGKSNKQFAKDTLKI